MRLIIDASVLTGEALRVSGRARLADTALELFAGEHTLDEAQHEIARRLDPSGRRASLTSTRLGYLKHEAAASILTTVQPLLLDIYAPLEAEALRRIPRDPDDWHVVAAALALECGIWTADHDFLGCGVATWTTQTLDSWLSAHAEDDAVS